MIERIPKLLLQIVQNRFELISLELQEEKVRLSQLLALALFSATLAIAGIVGAAILVVWLLPEDQKIVGAVVVVGVLLAGALILMLIARRALRRHTPFSGTIGSLKQDVHEL